MFSFFSYNGKKPRPSCLDFPGELQGDRPAIDCRPIGYWVLCIEENQSNFRRDQDRNGALKYIQKLRLQMSSAQLKLIISEEEDYIESFLFSAVRLATIRLASPRDSIFLWNQYLPTWFTWRLIWEMALLNPEWLRCHFKILKIAVHLIFVLSKNDAAVIRYIICTIAQLVNNFLTKSQKLTNFTIEPLYTCMKWIDLWIY